MNENRCQYAREMAGLSLKQTAKILCGSTSEDVIESIVSVEEANPDDLRQDERLELVRRLADVYGVRVEWMLGEIVRRDYVRTKSIRGADDLNFHDRDVIAEIIAATQPPSQDGDS